MLLTLTDLIGRFHPLFVHLPIGILLLACFFQCLTYSNRYMALQTAIPAMFFWGMLTAIASCISGYLLSLSGDYDEVVVGRHQWLGIATAILSAIMYLLQRMSVNNRIAGVLSVIIIVMISITGHIGGTLTHGDGYLADGLAMKGSSKGPALEPIPQIQEAAVYNDIVQPLLEARCYSCHGPSKQKGKLRLDQAAMIMKGGEDEGPAVVAGKADESAMIERLLLPLTDKNHMPPKEKPQLTKQEIELLHWWISTGASMDKKVKELPQEEKIKPVLLALESGTSTTVTSTPDVPTEPAPKGDEAMITRLKNAGVIISPVAQNSNYLAASFFTATKGADTLLPLLESLKKQLVWLKLDHAMIGDAAAKDIAKLTQLTRLQLNNTAITDAGMAELAALQQLQSLNLVGTKVTAAGVSKLQGLKNLKHIYLYQTGITGADWPGLQKVFPGAQLDSGGYKVPTLATDTTEVKAP